ncbi:MAG: DUF2730 family protein [Crocosphaera sp.]
MTDPSSVTYSMPEILKGIEEKFDKIEVKLEPIQKDLTDLKIEVTEVKTEVRNVKENVRDIKTVQNTLVNQVADLKGVKSLVIPIIKKLYSKLKLYLMRLSILQKVKN